MCPSIYGTSVVVKVEQSCSWQQVSPKRKGTARHIDCLLVHEPTVKCADDLLSTNCLELLACFEYMQSL